MMCMGQQLVEPVVLSVDESRFLDNFRVLSEVQRRAIMLAVSVLAAEKSESEPA